MKRFTKNIIVYVVLFAIVLGVASVYKGMDGDKVEVKKVTLSTFVQYLEDEKIKEIKIRRKNVRKKQKVLWKLFLSTLYLSAFTFGGGYVIVTLMKDKFVDKYHWIEENEMLDLIAIAQSAPGAIAVNGAIVVGYKLAGLAGVLTAIFGTVLPPFLIISVISVFYQMFCDNFIISQLLDGMQAGLGAVIASVVWDMAAGITKKKEWTSIVIMAAAFIASYVMEVPVVYIVLICIAMGVIRTVLAGRGKRKK